MLTVLERATTVGLISRAVDRLRGWVKYILAFLTVIGSGYYIAHYGFLSFLLRMIFSPVP